MLSDVSCLPDVLITLEIQCLCRLDMATSYYEHACEKDCNSLELMRGLFNCYARESSFAKQLKVCLRMYKLAQEDKFLLWAVYAFSAFSFAQEARDAHNLDEPEAFLVYMSITEQQAMYGPAHEILSKLGLTLLVVKFDKQHLAGGKLVAHFCDYAAAVEVFQKILESCSPSDLECLLNYFVCSLEDDSKWCGGAIDNKIQPPIYLACKIPQLSNENCGLEICKALKVSTLKNARNRCLPGGKDNDALEVAIYEYFNRVDHISQSVFQVLSKVEEYSWIENLLEPDFLTPELLKEEFSKMCTVPRIPKYFGNFCVGEGSRVHGTTIVLKTNKFIVLAGDGKLTSAYSDNALLSVSDKIRRFDDLCIAISGVWMNVSKTDSILRKNMRYLNKNGEGRPTVREFAEYVVEARILDRATEVIICAFDELEDGQPPVPCVSCADRFMCWDEKESFYCSGSCRNYANHILSEGNIRADMGLCRGSCFSRKALVYKAMFDNCTDGLANITVIDNCKNVRVMAREYISTTLWERHHHFFEGRVS
ncbi:hypothetical protein MKW92_004908 [Papaver armeniacum]|nr:hypothetical protein MKW92_004908 [Papaver armeniacum]